METSLYVAAVVTVMTNRSEDEGMKETQKCPLLRDEKEVMIRCRRQRDSIKVVNEKEKEDVSLGTWRGIFVCYPGNFRYSTRTVRLKNCRHCSRGTSRTWRDQQRSLWTWTMLLITLIKKMKGIRWTVRQAERTKAQNMVSCWWWRVRLSAALQNRPKTVSCNWLYIVYYWQQTNYSLAYFWYLSIQNGLVCYSRFLIDNFVRHVLVLHLCYPLTNDN